MNSVDQVTLGIALLGAGLGVFNTVYGLRRDRPKLLVEAVFKENAKGAKYLRINLVNAGHVPVTVLDVYLTGRRPTQARVPMQKYIGSRLWEPHKLDPGESLGIGVSPGEWTDLPFMERVSGLTLDLGAGRFIKLRSDALVQHARQLKRSRAKKAGKAAEH